MKKVKVTELKKNPGQQRTILDPDKLAILTEQIHSRGLDEDHPVVVTQDEEGGYRIVRGHRRTMAYVIADKVGPDATRKDINEYINSLCSVSTAIFTCTECPWHGENPVFDDSGIPACKNCGCQILNAEDVVELDQRRLADAFDQIISEAGDLEIPLVIWKFKSRTEEQLTLISDAFGAEDPDVLGQAFAFSEAVRLGASPMQLAANTGISVQNVYGLISLTSMPEAVQQLAANGKLLLSHIGKLSSINEGPMRDALYSLICNNTVNHAKIDMWIKAMKEWQVPLMELDYMEPVARNTVRLEQEAYNNASGTIEYWTAVAKGSSKDRFVAANISDEASMLASLPELGCSNCQLREFLPTVSKNLRGSVYPCVKDKTVKTCPYAVPTGDPWMMIAPSWVRSDKVIQVGRGVYFVNPDHVVDEEQEYTESKDSQENDAPAIKIQRDAIGKFMQINDTLSGSAHPLSTQCSTCGYRLTSSPTADPTLPHCMWARNRRSIQIDVLQPEDGRDYKIPACRQYLPTNQWKEMIPESKVDGSISEGQADRIITMIAGLMQQYGHAPLKQLTGVPIKSDEKYNTWFMDKYQSEKINLSHGQIITLVKWLVSEWHNKSNGTQPLELPTGLEVMFKAVPIIEQPVVHNEDPGEYIPDPEFA